MVLNDGAYGSLNGTRPHPPISPRTFFLGLDPSPPPLTMGYLFIFFAQIGSLVEYRALYLWIRDTAPKRLQKCRTLQRLCMATHCNTLQHTGAFLIVDMTPLIANRALLTGDRALLQKGARFIVFDALLVENRVLALKYRARIRPRMEKSHFGRPRTGDQPICICSIAE